MNMSIEKSDTVFHNLPQRRKGYKGFCIETSLATFLYPCPCSIENGKLKIENDSVANHFQLSIVNCQLIPQFHRDGMLVANNRQSERRKALNVNNPLQAKRSSGSMTTLSSNSVGVELLRSSVIFDDLPRAAPAACKGLFKFKSFGLSAMRVLFLPLRRTRDNQPQSHRDGMSAGIRTIIIDSTSPERATSIAQWQRPVNASPASATHCDANHFQFSIFNFQLTW
jgi:hypothetical protein